MPYFDSDLYVETWQYGPPIGNLNSSCPSSGPGVSNVKAVRLSSTVAFAESKDHSKWAVTNQSGRQWTCIGDINRQVYHWGNKLVLLAQRWLWHCMQFICEPHDFKKGPLVQGLNAE